MAGVVGGGGDDYCEGRAQQRPQPARAPPSDSLWAAFSRSRRGRERGGEAGQGRAAETVAGASQQGAGRQVALGV